MKDTEISPVEPLTQPPPSPGEYLLLIDPHNVPPHLGILKDGFYYSLSVKGVELEKEGGALLSALKKKGKEVLLIGISLTVDSPSLHSSFQAYEGSEPPYSSCLEPILDRCSVRDPTDGPGTVHDLIETLRKGDRLAPPHFLMGKESRGGHFRIPAYEEEDVKAHLRRYHRRKAAR